MKLAECRIAAPAKLELEDNEGAILVFGEDIDQPNPRRVLDSAAPFFVRVEPQTTAVHSKRLQVLDDEVS